MIKRIIFGLLIGVIGTFFYVQNDPWVRTKVGHLLKQSLTKTFNCKVSLTVDSYDVLFPTLCLSDLSMQAYDGSWSWHSERYITGFSWINFLKTGSIDLWAVLKKVDAFTQWLGDQPAIIPHLYSLMKDPDWPAPTSLSTIQFYQGKLKAQRDEGTADFYWDCDWKQKGSFIKANIKLVDGSIQFRGREYGSALCGHLSMEWSVDKKGRLYRMRVDSKCRIPQLGIYPICILSGSWHDGRGRFELQSSDHSFHIQPLIVGEKHNQLYIDMRASVPLALLYNVLFQTTDSPLKGSCVIQATGSVSDVGSLDGHIICQDITYPSFPEVAQLNGHFRKRGMDWNAQWQAESGIAHVWSGLLHWNAADQTGDGTILNECAVAIPYLKDWSVPAREAQLSWRYDQSTDRFQGNYESLLLSPTSESVLVCGKSTVSAQREIAAEGSIGSYKYKLAADAVQKTVSHIELCDAHHNPRLRFDASHAQNSYSAMIDFSTVQQLGNAFLQYELQGEGTIHAKGSKKDGLFETAFSFDRATVRLPQTYNFINGMRGMVLADFDRRIITIKDLFCSLHNGSMNSPEAVIWFDPSGTVPFVHIPFFINRCLVTVKQDLFATVSGDLLLTKKGTDYPHLAGHLRVNRSQLKENLFSEQAQKKLFQAAGTMRGYKTFPLTCDLSVETKDPVRVDTSFLQANAHAALRLSGSLSDPRVEGTISVPSGSLAFPYKPLNITKGEIIFSKDQPLNPLVNITAKNSIKHHAVTLNVTGSLREHMVLLESSPPLSEEQIVGLLISGAHEDSLDAIIPALLMQNVTNFIFSSHKLNFFDQHIKPWMKQINVTLKPKFGDQAGRGGLRGALEITVNDRWRALIEKNFSLTEDTNFELEYILSDDITFRVLRDERRDIGGEVEMKLKF